MQPINHSPQNTPQSMVSCRRRATSANTASPDSGRTAGSLRASLIASPHWGQCGAVSASFRTRICRALNEKCAAFWGGAFADFWFSQKGGGGCPARTLLSAQCMRPFAFRYAASGQSWVDPPRATWPPPPSAHWLLGRPDRSSKGTASSLEAALVRLHVNLLTWSSLLSQAGVRLFEKPDGASGAFALGSASTVQEKRVS